MKRYILPFLVASLAVFLIFSCATRETNPVVPGTDISDFDPGENPAGFFEFDTPPDGGPLDAGVGQAVVDADDPDAVISMSFNSVVDVNTLDEGLTLKTSGGSSITLAFDYTLGPATTVNVRPASDLTNGTTYIFQVKGDLLENLAEDLLDIDGDEVAGEVPDDYLTYYFTTEESDGTPGTPEVITTDILKPFHSDFDYFLTDAAGDDSVEVGTPYCDVSIRWQIVDQYINELGGVEVGAVPSSMISTSTVLLLDRITREVIPGTVSYDSVDATSLYTNPPYYWSAAFHPTGNLLPGHDYLFVLKAQEIMDAAGNKLNSTADILQYFSTVGTTADGTVLQEDVSRPVVVDFDDYGDELWIEFNELVDPATVNATSIVVTHNGQPYAGYFEVTTYDYFGDPATRVIFHANTYYSSGNYVYVDSWMIKDLAGNVMSNNYAFSW